MSDTNVKSELPWYAGISRYQWLVLVIASLGWVFDVFEGQIFVASMRDALPDLLGGVSPDHEDVRKWVNYSFGSFLLGGAVGGVFFGMLSDKIGRSKTMIFTILFYSLFTCFTALAKDPSHMVVLRFLVAMGVGGEWAVASAMVAEVMPTRSRAVMSSIFHASSVLGTLMAAAAGAFIVGNEALGENGWRIGFLIGVVPALLTVWIRWKLHEPESWQKARERAAQDKTQKTGSLVEIFQGVFLKRTLIGVTLAAIGLTTFWGCHIYGKNALMRNAQAQVLQAEGIAADASKEEKGAAFAKHKSEIKRAEMLSMTLNTIGGGLGLVLFGWISSKLGRRGAFILYHAGGLVMALLLFKVLIPGGASSGVLALVLPIFGFLTLGMHAGYAVYFPELYPTRLRGTGAGFCFNVGRLGAAAALIGAGAMTVTAKATTRTAEEVALYVSFLFAVGIVVSFLAPETRGQELPE